MPGTPAPDAPVVYLAEPQQTDNSQFWEEVNAVKFGAYGTGRRTAYRAIAFYISLTSERVCFASMQTKADRAGLTVRAMRYQHRALEASGHIEPVDGVSGGRLATRYRLVLPAPNYANPAKSAAFNPAKSAPEERKDRRSTSKDLHVRTYSPTAETAAVPNDSSKAVINMVQSFLSQKPDQDQEHAGERDAQTRLFAKLRRKLFLEVNDTMLDLFAASGPGHRKATLDALLADERVAAAKGEVDQPPASRHGFSTFAGTAHAPINGTRKTKPPRPQREGRDKLRESHQAYQASCEHRFDEWGGCTLCGIQRPVEAAVSPC